MTRVTFALILALAALLAPATARAQQDGERTAPPGNSAIDEYVETVPGAAGARPPRKPAGGEAPAGTLAPTQQEALEQQGEDGKALAALVDATAPSTAAPRSPQAQGGAPAPVPTAAADQLARADERAASPLKATLTAALGPNDGGGLGLFFPLILLASLLGMIALGVRRRRLSV